MAGQTRYGFGGTAAGGPPPATDGGLRHSRTQPGHERHAPAQVLATPSPAAPVPVAAAVDAILSRHTVGAPVAAPPAPVDVPAAPKRGPSHARFLGRRNSQGGWEPYFDGSEAAPQPAPEGRVTDSSLYADTAGLETPVRWFTRNHLILALVAALVGFGVVVAFLSLREAGHSGATSRAASAPRSFVLVRSTSFHPSAAGPGPVVPSTDWARRGRPLRAASPCGRTSDRSSPLFTTEQTFDSHPLFSRLA